MYIKKSIVLLTVLILFLFPAPVCNAQEDVALLQACAWEQYIDVFIQGLMDAGSLDCKVSNRQADMADAGLLEDRGITARTTILLDISTSMHSQMRRNITSLIQLMIKNIGKDEQYRIVTFGEQLTVLHDFTSDRYDLAAAAEKIEFNGKQSRIYDAVYNTIPKVQPIDGMPCYYRTIVITDGIDDTAGGVTKEELYLRLRDDTYPIDVVAVSKTKQGEPEKELAALTRMSRGRYINLNPDSDLEDIVSSLAVGNVFWMRALVPGVLLDGSTRQVDISDGSNSLQFDLKVPVFEAPAGETPADPDTGSGNKGALPSPAEDETRKETLDGGPAVETPSVSGSGKTQTGESSGEDSPASSGIVKKEPSSDSSRQGDEQSESGSLPLSDVFGEYTLAVYIGAGVIVVLAVVLIVVFAAKGKKNKNSAEGGDASGRKGAGQKGTSGHETEVLGVGKTNASSAAPGNTGAGGLFIRLRNIDDPDQVWEISLANSVLIGRAPECHLCIDERSVSRQQCKLYVNAAGYPAAENLSSANITRLNGELLNAPRRISEGDKLKCGRVMIMIDSIYVSSPESAESRSGGSGGTEFLNV